MSSVLNPEALGAQCQRCFLRTVRVGGPVGPEISRRAKVALVGEAPGKEEAEEGRPFVGPSGRELTTSLASVGIARDDVTIVNSIACRAPGNDLEMLMHRCQQTNKKLIAAGQEPFLNPIEACRPMMQHFIEPYASVITVGKTAMRSVTQMQASIMDMRGAPVTGVLAPVGLDGVEPWISRETLDPADGDPAIAAGGRFIRLLPTIHPAFVQRQRRWTKVFRADLARAFRWFSGNLGWREPRRNLHPTLSEARDFLYSGAPFYAYDVETDAKESLLARLRCIGFGTPEAAIVVPLLGIDGYKRFYTEDEEGAMLDMLRAWFTDRKILKVGHNAGMYDRIVIETRLGVTPVPLVDSILIHRNVDSELPHNLAFVGALFTDVARAWKASHAATQSQSDEELFVYNVGDVVVNARIMQPLIDACTMQGQMQVALIDHKSQSVCVGYHKNGIFVDQAARRELDEKYRKEALEHLHILRMTLGNPGFNPNSVLAVRTLLFETWGLTPLETTKLGDPSTNDDTLRKLLLLKGLPQERGDFLRSTRKYRRAVKFRGTFIQPLRPFDELLYADDPLAVDVNTVEGAAILDDRVDDVVEDVQGDLSPKMLHRALKKAIGKTLADGRHHSNWNVHTPTCVTPDTWVLTESGLAQVGNLPGWGPVGSQVPAAGFRLHDGATLQAVSDQVNPGAHPTQRVTTVLGLTVTGPLHHRVQVAEGARFMRLGPREPDGSRTWAPVEPTAVWRRLDALRPGDYAMVPIGMNVWASTAPALPTFTPFVPAVRGRPPCEVTLPAVLTEDLAFFMGVYNADGSCHDANGGFQIRISNTTGGSRLEAVRACAARLFGEEAVRTSVEGTIITSKVLGPWASALGLNRGIGAKRAPSWILSAPKPFVLAYLRGLAFDSHLSVANGITPEWSYTGTETLCREVQMMLLNLGIPASLTDQRTEVSPQTWCLNVTCVGPVAAICVITGQTTPVPTRAGDTSRRRPKFIQRGNTLWLRVTAVEDAGVQPVLDVIVPSTHRFWSNGLVSHNTGRKSSSGMNVQNVPWLLRAMLAAEEGHGLAAADYDQLELRISAAYAQADRYLQAFKDGKDPHAITAEAIYGEMWRGGSEKDKKRIRDFSKRFVYAVIYGASVETVHDTIAAAENDKGELIFPWVTLRETDTLVRRWMKENPEYARWWDTTIAAYRRDLFLEEPVLGRRRFFLDGEDRNEIINFRVQCFPPRVKVLTGHGYVPIGELATRDGFTAWTGKKWAPAIAFQKGAARVYRVITNRGALECDASHKFLRVGATAFEWAKTGTELRAGDVVARDLARPLEFGMPMPSDDAYALGFWYANGSARKGGAALYLVMRHQQSDGVNPDRGGEPLRARLSAWMERHGWTPRLQSRVGCDVLASYTKAACAWLGTQGVDITQKAHTKRIPDTIWRADLGARGAFLRGFLDGDGYAQRPNGAGGVTRRVSIHLCQKPLLEDLRLLMQTVGVAGGAIVGPHVTDTKGHVAYRCDFNAVQTREHLGWGAPGKRRTEYLVPRFEIERILPRLPKLSPPGRGGARLTTRTQSETVIVSRLRKGGTTTPYMLQKLGVDDTYDYATILAIEDTGRTEPVFTLSVDDPEHAYVAEGIIAANSAGASCVSLAEIALVEGPLPSEKWGPGTGLIHNGHDALTAECPCTHLPKRGEKAYKGADALYGGHPPLAPGETCPLVQAAHDIGAAMTMKFSSYDVMLTATPKIGRSFAEV